MIPKIWRLSENSGDDNLGLTCTEQGLMLGRTALIERRDGRFVVRERSEIEQLLGCAYRSNVVVDRLMPGLATVAAALNANDKTLARIAAVHLRIPDLPDQAARDAMKAADVFVGVQSVLIRRCIREPIRRRIPVGFANGRRRRQIIFNTNSAKRRPDAALGCLGKRRRRLGQVAARTAAHRRARRLHRMDRQRKTGRRAGDKS